MYSTSRYTVKGEKVCLGVEKRVREKKIREREAGERAINER